MIFISIVKDSLGSYLNDNERQAEDELMHGLYVFGSGCRFLADLEDAENPQRSHQQRSVQRGKGQAEQDETDAARDASGRSQQQYHDNITNPNGQKHEVKQFL
jgi:hypothetical protein